MLQCFLCAWTLSGQPMLVEGKISKELKVT